MDPMVFETPGALRLSVRVRAGSVTVAARDTAQTRVEFQGERGPNELAVDFTDRGDGAHLTVEERDSWMQAMIRQRSVDLRLEVPKGTVVRVETMSADLRTQGRLGDLTYRTASGDLRFDEVDGDLSVKSASGDVSGEQVTGRLRCQTASGDIRVGLAGSDVQIDSASGDVELGELSAGQVKVRSVSGEVDLGVASNATVRFDLHSLSGEAEVALGEAEPGPDGPQIELHATTVSGDIRVHGPGRDTLVTAPQGGVPPFAPPPPPPPPPPAPPRGGQTGFAYSFHFTDPPRPAGPAAPPPPPDVFGPE